MIQIFAESSGKVVGFKVSGKLTGEDYKRLIPYIEEIIEQTRPIRVLCEIEDFDGAELEAVWEDLKFGLRHFSDIERMALVGREKWLEWAASLGNHFLMKTDLRFFELSRVDEAWKWLRG